MRSTYSPCVGESCISLHIDSLTLTHPPHLMQRRATSLSILRTATSSSFPSASLSLHDVSAVLPHPQPQPQAQPSAAYAAAPLSRRLSPDPAAHNVELPPSSSAPISNSDSSQQHQKQQQRPYADRLMQGELPSPLPSLVELAEDWYLFGPLPRGKRCLAVVNPPAARGGIGAADAEKGLGLTMTLYSRREGKPVAVHPASTTGSVKDAGRGAKLAAAFGSAMVKNKSKAKSGRRIRFPAPAGLPAGTELDCILPAHTSPPSPSASHGLTSSSPHHQHHHIGTSRSGSGSGQTGTLFILDILRWGRRTYEDCDTEFRTYWRDAKMAELPAFRAPVGCVFQECKEGGGQDAQGKGPQGGAGRKKVRIIYAPFPFILQPVRAYTAPLHSSSKMPSGLAALEQLAAEYEARDGAGAVAHADAANTKARAGEISRYPLLRLLREGGRQHARVLVHSGMITADKDGQDSVEEMGMDVAIEKEKESESEMQLDVAAFDAQAQLEEVEVQVSTSHITVGDGRSRDDSDDDQDDGWLLVHRLACYEPGTGPLALWLPPPSYCSTEGSNAEMVSL